jgi:alanine transaminase
MLSAAKLRQPAMMGQKVLFRAFSTNPEAATTPQTGESHSWNETTMSQQVRTMEYAVRGQVVIHADKLAAEGKDILYTNIGNPQAVGQKPITYYRQVMALCDLPAEDGVDHPDITKVFPADVVEKARKMRDALGSSGTGAYTGSQGIKGFREDVANYITARDGRQAFPDDIFLTNGASTAIEIILTTLLASDQDGVMIPIPQYPIYSALIAKLNGHQIGYELDESKNWAATIEELEKQLSDAQANGLAVKALAIINPGNPTGQVFCREELQVILRFCADNGIVLLADEVYQQNVFAEDKEFLSAMKVALETPGCENLQIVSFHSISKGLIGECGRRGGYMELHNIDPFVQSQIYKLASAGLCANVPGQVMTSLMLTPPKPGDASYERFAQEESDIYDGLKRKAKALVDGLNLVDGISCNSADGAMYAFPSIQLPPAAIAAAEAQDMTPDTMYALSLLDHSGICVVPASGFGQKQGRVGFRTTFLPPDDKMTKAIDQFAAHHKYFCEKYS